VIILHAHIADIFPSIGFDLAVSSVKYGHSSIVTFSSLLFSTTFSMILALFRIFCSVARHSFCLFILACSPQFRLISANFSSSSPTPYRFTAVSFPFSCISK
jgi:hypothetical protein